MKIKFTPVYTDTCRKGSERCLKDIESSVGKQGYFSYTRREIRTLLPHRIESVLEIGCGAGNTLAWLKDNYGCSWVGGVEIDQLAVTEARTRLDAVFAGDIEKLELQVAPESLDL